MDEQKNTDRTRAWSSPSEAPVDSGVGRQAESMRQLARGGISRGDFAREWLDARRFSLRQGERVRDPFERILDQIFFVLEDEYAIDPTLRGPNDISDEELAARVKSALEGLDELDAREARQP